MAFHDQNTNPMDPNQQLPVTFKPSYTKLLYSFIIAIIFTAGSLYLMQGWPILGAFMALFFGLCILVFGVQFLPGCASLEIRQDGFTVTNMFQKNEYSWSTIESFAALKFAGNMVVTWKYVDSFAKEAEDERELSNKILRTEASLPDTYGMSAEDLTDLMNSFLQRYR